MNQPAPSPEAEHEEFSLPLFVFTLLATQASLLAGLRLLAPEVWTLQFVAPLWKGVTAFLCLSLVNAFVEYVFHRYVLHMPAVPLLSRLYRQHTLHHALTRIGRKPSRNGRGLYFIENKFPIVEPEQGEASFFPWYSMAIFAAVLTPLLVLLQWLLPSFPWFLAGFAALACSLTLYEVLHAINHWPFEKWEPLIEHPRWGRFWRPVYAFHLRHHAVTDCNESISGFFGLPVADLALGTFVLPETIYADGEDWTPEKFRHPRPCRLIRSLDTLAQALVHKRRLAATEEHATPPEAPCPTRGEQIAAWVSHGIGLAWSVTGLVLLVVFSSLRGNAWHVVSFSLFGLAMLGLYAVSTLRKVGRGERARRLFGRLEPAAVFLLIAGTYSPFLLTTLRGPWGWSLFSVLWGLCGAGAALLLCFGTRYRLATTLAHVLAAGLLLTAIKPLIAKLPEAGLWLLLAGALCYILGVLVHSWHRLRYHDTAWHAFVLGGSTCHFIAALMFLLPKAA